MDKEQELYDYLKNLPDFDNLMLPKSFYEKFNIKPKKSFDTFKEAIDNNYAMKCAFAPNKGKIIDIKTPDDYKFPEFVIDNIPLIVEQNPSESSDPLVEEQPLVEQVQQE